MSFDAIIIGGGHNGLTAAATLAKAGRKVLLLEAADTVGGGASTVEFAPGFRTSGLAHIINRLDPDVVKAIGLDTSGFEATAMPTAILSETSEAIVLRGAYGESIDGVGKEEAAAFAALRKKLLFHAGLLRRFMKKPPPELGNTSLKDLAAHAATGLKLLSQGREEARDVLRMLLMNVADISDEFLTDDRLKGLLAFDATLGLHLGPRSPTSLMGLYYRLTGEALGASGGQFLPRGGMGAVAQAFAEAATAAGATIRTASPVRRIIANRGLAGGVELEDGEILMASTILSAIHPRTTFHHLVDPADTQTGLSRAIGHIRSNGDVAKLNLALDKVPQFQGLSEADHKGRLVIARSMNHVETAFNPSKYGEYSPDPVMEITLPSLSDPKLADTGCTLSAMVQFAPYALREGWESGKPKFLEIVLDGLERHAPGLRASVEHAELLTPADIETRYRMPGGHWSHGEMQPDQLLFNRPVHAAAGYSTPLEGLYLASAGSHPGGGISGLPGLLSARHILAGGSR
ncbi:phytoene dehydrogenase-like protein [Hoeflea marina]|uniref:Pyridine nucleotide-disulfide oxidoreductase domain-containing protein 2 n=1 Tax=Hoeflea marina TaxID=274592 RepID=A0A317PTM5_9HYPH|nr:NAD(P)/FAD-dependent oxidoreductase [Hoeflea marina]PWW04055.1 phytoene dehydrogenase-like protein [Hoeflea marina]